MTQTKIAPNRLKRYRRMWRDIRADWILYLLLVPGMVFTIEPMINMGTWKVFIDADDEYGWEVITGDELPSAQWEHTFVMTEHGLEILTY